MKEKNNIISGVVYVLVTFNNVHITVTDNQGNVQAWSSSGSVGFKGKKKSTPYAAQFVATNLMNKLKRFHGLKMLHVCLFGSCPVRDSALRAINAAGIVILSMKDLTPERHNGVRLRRKRRVNSQKF